MKTKMTSNLFGSVLCGALMIGLLMTATCGGAGPNSLSGAGSGSSQMGFTATGSMQTARAIHTATLLTDGKVLITGGQGAGNIGAPNYSPLSSAELFDPAVGSFTHVAGATTSPGRTVAIPLLSGKVLIIGGQSCESFDDRNGVGVSCEPLASAASAELFDPAAGTFTATGNMAVARAFPTATRLLDGRVLVTGENSVASGDTSAELFDEATGTFTFTGSMSVARVGATASRLQNGQVLIVGGYASDSSGEPSNSAELYDPASGTFNATGAMVSARLGHTATLLSNGKVLVAGGDNFGAEVSAELFDPATGQFSVTGNMNTDHRVHHTAVLLNDGKVLLAGGLGSAGRGAVLASAELFDPATGQFSAVANMKSGRDQHTATLLANGTVLVTGGFNASSIVAVATAEIFQP